ncbi:MAG: hypothetical protein AAF317_01795 [Pseudomonadota bacterium]
MFHKVGGHRQALPLQRDITGQLEEMKRAALRLANLAQGGDGRGTPSQMPEWAQDGHIINTESDGSFETDKRRANLALHPVLHERLVEVLDELDPDVFGTTNRERWNRLANLFESIRTLSNLLDITAKLARSAGRGEVAPSHRSANLPRRWARTRLLWIWRDLIGREVRLSLKDPSEHTTVDTPEPNDCIRFVIQALERIDPVKPHNYPALVSDLRRASDEIPKNNLLLPVK